MTPLSGEMVELHPHSPDWAGVAAAESARLLAVLGQRCMVAVHHVGSTAVAGIRAKPIVDLLAEVSSLAALDEAADEVRALGYRWRGENGFPGRRFCTLDDAATGRRLVHLHCYAAGSQQVERYLAFRDYLLAHPARAKDYEGEKLRCRDLWPNDRLAYTTAKSAWIEGALAEASVWRRGGRGG